MLKVEVTAWLSLIVKFSAFFNERLLLLRTYFLPKQPQDHLNAYVRKKGEKRTMLLGLYLYWTV